MDSSNQHDPLLALLHKYWHFDAFRPLQREIIDSVLSGRDTLALLPTGGGKSVCYQLPALASDGLALVVSPLISLMKDQVQNLRDRGIKAACIVSGMNAIEQGIVLNNALYGKLKLLYVSPERLKNPIFIGHFRQMKVSLIAVDEAHCISQWGYDFRPSYLEVAALRQLHPTVPVLALSATATPAVVDDIQHRLLFRQPNLFQSSFFRPNLAYMVLREPDKMGRLLRIIRRVGGSGIIYVRNRRRSQEVARWLVANRIAASFYHAGLDAKERDMVQAQWMQSLSQVMVATNAFGMGIDKPDVRFVIHLDIPDALESYFQEAGRAGRDGNKAYAVLLFDDADVANLKKSIATNFPPLSYIRNVYRGICNFFSIPVGSGADSVFDFDIQALCDTYNFNFVEFFRAARFLEAEGLIALPPQEDAASRLFIPVGREEFYRFQVANKRYDVLFQQLLRLYGGLFSDYVIINEKHIARQCYWDVDRVEKALLQLDALKIVSYRKHSDKPQIVFSSNRVDAGSLYLVDTNYHLVVNAARQRLDAMLAYLDAKQCRSQQLLAYFGERHSAPCGLCDCCLSNTHVNVGFDADACRRKALQLLRQKPLSIDDLVAALSAFCGQAVVEADLEALIRQMVDNRELGMNNDFTLFA